MVYPIFSPTPTKKSNCGSRYTNHIDVFENEGRRGSVIWGTVPIVHIPKKTGVIHIPIIPLLRRDVLIVNGG
jgi:hypothetical protein